MSEAGDTFSASLAGGLVSSPAAEIVVAEWADPGGPPDPGGRPRYVAPLHVHHADDEAWYVLEGALAVRAGDRDVEVPPGGAVLVPRGTPHTYWNASAGRTRYLLVMTPRIRDLIDALHALTERSEDAVAEVFREHRSAYLGWP